MDNSACPYPSCDVLSLSQLLSLQAAVRATASVSLLACLLVIASYAFSTLFHTPLNRLIFYATWGNLLAHVAELIAWSGPRAGITSSLCKFQAFFIEWFTSADALWNLCIAINVYLVIFRHYSIPELRKLEWKYFLFCYGFQFIPALVFLFINTESRGRIYGDAITWCWISDQWGILRLSVYFGPIWFSFVVILSIYIAAGIKIYIIERGIKNFAAYNYPVLDATSPDALDEQLSGNPPPGDDQSTSINRVEPVSGGQQIIETQPSRLHGSKPANQASPNSQAPTVDFSIGSMSLQTQNRATSKHEPVSPNNSVSSRPTIAGGSGDAPQQEPPEESSDNLESLPGAANLTHPTSTGAMADLESQLSAQTPGSEETTTRRGFTERKAARAYAKLASLYFLSLLVTWIPPTSNRTYIFAHPASPSFALLLASGVAVALQGFWNGVIFFSTSWDAVKSSYKTLKSPHNWSMPALFRRPFIFLHFLNALIREGKIRPRLSSK
ncbi:uncharacterized protein CIMG_00505 [Coccidioides immitis RS]|uniref:G-protein coupled receptors family 2 profile 2 domain-containing protein n=2 Tax=Coccidioides TaxID=5500 RepID=J3KH52_COCIM|nr:uncharacterized protein CIMG_00505 [Coccidioides immitis RS]EAS35151.3 hypothetical protein CIMG_00505 [Coccidioides immitis RS]KMM66045.1 hypothetical protein CPAG_02385 [Coccidioides posadasii RMSCC 3488]